MNSRLFLVSNLLLLMFVSHTVLAEASVTVSAGYEQTSGDYGLLDDTEIISLPLTIQYIENAWRFSLGLEFIQVTGDGSIIPGGNGVIRGNTASNSQTSSTPMPSRPGEQTLSGPGDITTSVSYAFPRDRYSYMFYELTGSVKWGTASSNKNLGTGENDYSASIYSLYDKYPLQPYLSLGYLFVGDTSTLDYNDVFFSNAGLVYQFSPTASVSVNFEYQQATINGNEDSRMFGLYANKQFSYEWSANVYLLNGLSDSVADSTAGLSLLRRF